MMYHCIAIGFYNLSDAENFEYVRNSALHEPIDHSQEDSEERGRPESHGTAPRVGRLLPVEQGEGHRVQDAEGEADR